MFRDSEGDQEVFGGQEFVGLLLEPCFGLLMLTLGTGAILTGVIVVVELLTVFTEPGMAAEKIGSTRQDILHDFFLMGRHNSAVAFKIFSAVLLEYVGESGHRSAMT